MFRYRETDPFPGPRFMAQNLAAQVFAFFPTFRSTRSGTPTAFSTTQPPGGVPEKAISARSSCGGPWG